MNRRFDFKVIVLTVLLTIGVIGFWEVALRPLFFGWVDARYPGDARAELRWNIKQRFEHFFISFAVDALVVTILLRLVHRQQRRLLESEERYRALFEQAGDGIGVIRLPDYHLVEANDRVCEILGLKAQECVDRDIRGLLPTNKQLEFMITPNGQTASENELTIQTPNGNSRPVSVSFTPLSTQREQMMMMSLRDLSIRKQLEAQERIAGLGRAAAQVAHEVKNPLAGLLLYALHLQSKAGKFSEGEASLVDKIVNTINHLNSRVEQILGFARPTSLTLKLGDLNQTVTDILELLRPQLEANQVEVLLSTPDHPAYAMLDESSIRGALMNLMLNAVEAMPDGGILSVAINQTHESLQLKITDTGRGIAEEEAKKIFEPFFTTKEKGLGLGMPYAKKIIDQHGGTISLNSQLGEGTTISIALPAVQKEANNAA